MADRSDLDQASFIICAELVTIYIAEVNLNSGQSACKPLENAIHFGFNKTDYLAVYQDVLVTADLNLHAFLYFPRAHPRTVPAFLSCVIRFRQP
jgi:hypothetical protein